MVTQLTQYQNKELSTETVKKYLCPQATDSELYMFVNLCKSQNLNPWIKEAHLIKYGSAPATIIVGKDVFTKRAFNHPKFNGFEAGIIVQRGDKLESIKGSFKLPTDKLLGGWAKVYIKGFSVPIEDTVSMEEYCRSQATWKTMPATMIRKVALVHALREAFPDLFQGLYDESEMNVDIENQNIKKDVTIPEIKVQDDQMTEAVSLAENIMEAKVVESVEVQHEVKKEEPNKKSKNQNPYYSKKFNKIFVYNSFMIKDKLKQRGYQWDKLEKVWFIDESDDELAYIATIAEFQ